MEGEFEEGHMSGVDPSEGGEQETLENGEGEYAEGEYQEEGQEYEQYEEEGEGYEEEGDGVSAMILECHQSQVGAGIQQGHIPRSSQSDYR